MASKRLCIRCGKKVFGVNHEIQCAKKHIKKEAKPIELPEIQLKPCIELRIKLIKCGKHFINPNDVACIKEAKKDLYIIKLRSEPNPEWPIWVNEKDIAKLIEYFEIVE